MGADPIEARAARRRRFPAVALLACALFAFLIPCAVEPLNLASVLGFPLGFFMVAQGALIAFLVIAVLAARRRDRLAREQHVDA